MTDKLRARFQKEKRMMSQRKDYHIYSCPGCGQKIRIPRGGFKKVEIECPKCHTKFIKRRWYVWIYCNEQAGDQDEGFWHVQVLLLRTLQGTAWEIRDIRPDSYSLSYDMTFVILLLSGLYEPKTYKGTTRCIFILWENSRFEKTWWQNTVQTWIYFNLL